jgi:L-cysteine S-thiosulfotransferase
LKRGLRAACLLAALCPPAAAQEPGALDLFVRADKGHCIACHQLPPGAGPETRNDVGSRLEGARMRELGREALKDILQDATRRNPESVMPPYGRHRLLDAEEIERLAEFLHALP